jgi:hypothetical protein
MLKRCRYRVPDLITQNISFSITSFFILCSFLYWYKGGGQLKLNPAHASKKLCVCVLCVVVPLLRFFGFRMGWYTYYSSLISQFSCGRWCSSSEWLKPHSRCLRTVFLNPPAWNPPRLDHARLLLAKQCIDFKTESSTAEEPEGRSRYKNAQPFNEQIQETRHYSFKCALEEFVGYI